MKNVRVLLALLFMAAPVLPAQTLTFDDLDCSEFGIILEQYQGLEFSNTDCLLGSEFPNSGYETVGGGGNVIVGAFSDPFGFARGEAFSLTSFRASAAWYNNVTLLIEGFLGGVQVQSIELNLAGPNTAQLVMLGWTNIDEVLFTTSGGTDAGLEGEGSHVAIDDLVIAAADPGDVNVIPEPSSFLLLAAGLGGVGAMRVRRRGRKG